MAEALKNFDAALTLIWVVPGAFIALFRSFAIRGAFPTIGKDDVAAFLLGSVVYYFVLALFVVGLDPAAGPLKQNFSSTGLFIVVVIVPAFAGAVLGLVEASDSIGRLLRKIGIRLPSPDATAWETMFREMTPNAVLLVTLKDGTTVAGRWVGGKGGSASSSDPKIMDIYLGQIGSIDGHGHYVPKTPRRAAYLAAAEIRFIEVIAV